MESRKRKRCQRSMAALCLFAFGSGCGTADLGKARSLSDGKTTSSGPIANQSRDESVLVEANLKEERAAAPLAINPSGVWRFADCCTVRLPLRASVYAGPPTIDGPFAYRIVLPDGEAGMRVINGAIGLPPGGIITKNRAGVTILAYDDGGSARRMIALVRKPLRSELDRVTVVFEGSPNNLKSRQLVAHVAETLSTGPDWIVDKMRLATSNRR